jgi:hypothetical protein
MRSENKEPGKRESRGGGQGTNIWYREPCVCHGWVSLPFPLLALVGIHLVALTAFLRICLTTLEALCASVIDHHNSKWYLQQLDAF